jgi:hypothetical protein
VTLGMLSVARSLAIVLSQNRMIYDFGPYGDTFNAYRRRRRPRPRQSRVGALAPPGRVRLRVQLHAWGNYLYAIGSNENAGRLTGVPVNRIKMQAYIVSGVLAALSAVMIVGWQGSAINALGQGYELRVIASTVIGGANLMGGEGGAYGALVGAALIEVIRNSLLMAGVDSNWQGAFVGLFIVLAVLLQRIRGRRSAEPGDNKGGHAMRGWLMGVAAAALLASVGGAEAQAKKVHLRAGAEEHEQPLLRPGPGRCKKAEAESNGHDRVHVHRPRRARGGDEQVQIVNDLIAKRWTASPCRPPTPPPWAARWTPRRRPASRS